MIIASAESPGTWKPWKRIGWKSIQTPLQLVR
jgi:hypothetical protein